MGMCTYKDIFQDKIDKLLGYIEGVVMYINYILIQKKVNTP